MKLLLQGHEDRYAVEQLQLALFPEESMEPVDAPFTGDGAVSALHTGALWLTATAKITLHGNTVRASRRMKRADADVPSRRRLLQNAYYAAAMLLRVPPESRQRVVSFVGRTPERLPHSGGSRRSIAAA